MSRYIMVLGFEDSCSRICEPTGGIIDVEQSTVDPREQAVITAVMCALIDPHKTDCISGEHLLSFESLKKTYPFAGAIDEEVTLYFEE